MPKYSILFLFMVVDFCWAQSDGILKNAQYVEPFDNIVRFSDDRIIFSFYEESLKKTGTYTLDNSSGIPFINVTWDNGIVEKILILSNDSNCYLYNRTGMFFQGTNRSQNGELWLYAHPDKISASSYLVEGDVSYSPESNRRYPKPLWVEGAGDNGIHEKLFIVARAAFALHISIGYVSYSNPELYKENSRPKKIRLAVKGKFSIDVNLEDTPDFQMVTLPIPLKDSDVLELEILEVYPETKYKDTCINEIVYDYVPWRP